MLIRLALIAVGVALLNKALKRSTRPQTNTIRRGSEPTDQIIEIDDYEIVDEIQNRASKGHKVIIQWWLAIISRTATSLLLATPGLAAISWAYLRLLTLCLYPFVSSTISIVAIACLKTMRRPFAVWISISWGVVAFNVSGNRLASLSSSGYWPSCLWAWG